MKRAAPISLLLTILFLAPTIVTVLPTSASTLMYQSVAIRVEGPTTAVVNQQTTLAVHVTEDGSPAKGATVYFYLNDKPVEHLSGGTIGAITADSFGNAYVTPWTFVQAGTFTFRADVTTSSGATATTSWTCTVTGGAATPTAQQPTATPSVAKPTPQATIVKPTTPATPTPTPQQPGIYVPPIIVINNVFPGTITQGTGPWGGLRITVKNPGPDKLRTPPIDFASNPEDIPAHYNEQVNFANADAWKLTARGEKTYGDHSKDYRYSRFTKGTSALLLAAQGNNSTDKQYNIPGDVLITEQDETFSSGTAFSLFGLEGLAAYAVVAVIAIAILALIVVGVLYYRRKDTGSEQQRYYPPR
ncbi:MAG: hypothetical protein WCI87_04105 [Euryarchaeota archaeon]